MSGTQIATSVTIIDSLFGFQAISLTNMTTSAQSLIAAGSKVEIAGSYFTFGSNETPNATSYTTVTTGNTAYISLLPAGTAGSQTVTAEYAETAPTWSTSKQGWYASAASTTRYIAGVTKTSETQFDDAFILEARQVRNKFDGMTVEATTFEGGLTGDVTGGLVNSKGTSSSPIKMAVFEIGDWDMSATTSIDLTVGTITMTQITGTVAWIRNDANTSIQNLEFSASGVGNLGGRIDIQPSGGHVELVRFGTGPFDSINFNATSYNRGWLHVWYYD